MASGALAGEDEAERDTLRQVRRCREGLILRSQEIEKMIGSLRRQPEALFCCYCFNPL